MKNICIIGYGVIGPIHAAAIEKIKNAKLYAVCDVDGARLDACRREYDVKTFTDFNDVLNCKEIDAVHICTPHYLHFDMIKSALEHGKAVVAEKPVTMKKEQFSELLKLKNSDKVCVVFQNRLNSSVLRMKKIIDEKKYGEIKAVKAILTWHRTKEYYQSGAWRGKWDTEGGGVVINQAVHTLDLMSYLVEDISAVSAVMHNFSLSDAIETEDSAMAYIEYKSGISGMFFATNAYSKNSAPEVEIVFEDGVVCYREGRLFENGEGVEKDELLKGEKAYWGTGHIKLISDFYDNGKFFAPKDVKNTMETLFAIYESAKNGGRRVEIQEET